MQQNHIIIIKILLLIINSLVKVILLRQNVCDAFVLLKYFAKLN